MSALQLLTSLDGYLPSVILVCAAVLLMCWQRLRMQLDPREPPVLKPTVPLVGHVLGMMWWQHKYFQILSNKFPVPMFTMPIFRSKVYIVADPQLTHAAIRSKTLTMDPFIKEISPRLADLTPKVAALMNSEDEAFLRDHFAILHTALLPGPYLDEINMAVLAQLATTINNVGIEWETKPALFNWVRDEFYYAVGKSFFGEHTPIEKHVVQALSVFEEGQLLVIMGIPKIFARKPLKARQVVMSAMGNFYRAGLEEGPDVSWFIKNRVRVHRKYNLTCEEMGNIDLTILSGATMNAAPTLFWILCYVLNDAVLTEEIRAEVATIVTTENSTAAIDISKFHSHCPLLVSVYKEAQRMTNNQTGVRSVLADTILSAGGKSYLLKKDAVVQLPTSITHTSAAVWGADVDTFSPRRFLKSEDRVGKAQKQAFIPFGGGKHLCPGRHLAFAEILGFVSATLMGLEVRGTDGGPFRMEEARLGRFAVAVQKPVGKALRMGVKVRRRPGWEGVNWAFVGRNKGEVDLGS